MCSTGGADDVEKSMQHVCQITVGVIMATRLKMKVTVRTNEPPDASVYIGMIESNATTGYCSILITPLVTRATMEV